MIYALYMYALSVYQYSHTLGTYFLKSLIYEIPFCSYRLMDSKNIKQLKRHSLSYFLEIVSRLCFGGCHAPEPALIETLMRVIFTENEPMNFTTREITHIADGKTDEIPVVRSSLLQLLLEHE